jgi:hypothetical protein
MPISTNAPFNEFGNSMILRDIEQLYLALNGAGTGSSGDGQTQDQSEATSQDSGGLPDLSGLATTDYVDAAIAGIPDVPYPISIANGGTDSTTAALARLALGVSFGSYTHITTPGSGTFTVPAGVSRLCVNIIGGGGVGDGGTGGFATVSGVTISDGTLSGGSGASIVASFDVTPGESISYVCGAKGVYGVSAPSASSISGTGLTMDANGGSNASRGGAVGYGGAAIISAFSAARNGFAIGMPGTNGCSSGTISAGGITFTQSGNLNVESAVVYGAGYASGTGYLYGRANWTSGANDGRVLFLY